MHKSIGWHTRLRSDLKVKTRGGGFGGQIDIATIDRLVKAHFTVRELPSGTLTFVDKEGRDVNLYISVDPDMTEVGKAAAKAAQALRMTVQQKLDERRAVLDDLLDGLDIEEAIRRLKSEE